MTARWMMALGAASLLWAVPAYADDTESDLKCMILGVELAASPDPQLQTPGQLTALYFLGRLNGRAPGDDLEPKIIAQAKTMNPGDVAATAQSCSTILTVAGKALGAANEALAKLNADTPPKDPAPKK